MLAALQVPLAGAPVLVKLSPFADLGYSSRLWLELERVLAKGRASPGVGDSRGAGGAGEQPRCRTVFWCKVKDSGWDFPPKLRYYGSRRW